ncbi:helix-turn-helix domain-containing protein [Salipiger sp. IMCC34102]|uniref:helix-turn-helix domain-containing protein n=1 Tax=Salipiger sp. IMCC34102 TaxID=2510647 RepID=UPI00101CE92D|nr:helix-turn-helix domain-containing protein [Salipiger sp. IMCC34102]RYH04110.1 helix-turn-helix domain-containing protein [Salipiger sp. IMCC34102]
MSHAATNWAIRQKGLKPATKLVLWFLADCHNGHTGQCNPRQELLAEECEMSRSTINVHLAKLEEVGLIKRVQRFDGRSNKQRATDYVLMLDGPEKPVSGIRTRAQDVVDPVSGIRTRAVSENGPEPCPENGESRVRNPDSMNPGIEPGTQPRAEPRSDGVGYPDFVSAYPGPVTSAAPEAYRRVVASGVDPQRIVSAAKAYARDPVVLRGYPKKAENWLASTDWSEAPEAVTPDPSVPQLPSAVADIKSGNPARCYSVSPSAAREFVGRGYVTEDECKAAGVHL